MINNSNVINTSALRKAVFLDRDGTINQEVSYLYKPTEFSFIPGAIEAIKIFHDLGYLVIVVTNQSGVARGYYKEDDIKVLHAHIDYLLLQSCINNRSIQNKIINHDSFNYNREESGFNLIDAYYYCPHHPDGTVSTYAKDCNCRKPKTGMIDKAVLDFNISLTNSIIIGDKEIDIQCGKNAGIKQCVLVRTGHEIDEESSAADIICDDLISYARSLKKAETRLVDKINQFVKNRLLKLGTSI